MIRITKEADYAIVLMGHLVNTDTSMAYTSRDLSARTRLPLPMVGKILKRLVRSRLLDSHRGVKGGYRLARDPSGISVADIIAVMDGPIGMTVCSTHSGDCEFEPTCPAQSNWNRINQAVLGALRGISLLDMAHPRSTCGCGSLDDPGVKWELPEPFGRQERPLMKETL